MTGVSKFVVGSTVNLAGEALNVAFTAFDRVKGATEYLIFGAKKAVDTTESRARDFANNPDKYANKAENKVDGFVDDVEEVASDTAEFFKDAADEAMNETDRRTYEERTKEELYELAVERDIEGRSLMNKDELIVALRADRS